jgi:hypothetical protein
MTALGDEAVCGSSYLGQLRETLGKTWSWLRYLALTALLLNSVSLAVVLVDKPSVKSLWVPVVLEAVFLALTLNKYEPFQNRRSPRSGTTFSLGLRIYAIVVGLGFLALGIFCFIWFPRGGTGLAIFGSVMGLGALYVSFLAIRGFVRAGKLDHPT